MTNAGYIRLYRQLLEHPIFANCGAKVLKVWIACLLRANWKPSKAYDGQTQVDIPAGAFLFSQESFAALCRVSRQELRTALGHLVRLRCVTIRPTNRASVLIVENWSSYQTEATDSNQQTNHESTSDQPTANQRSTTEEEYKKGKRQERPSCASADAPVSELPSTNNPPSEARTLFPVPPREKRQKTTNPQQEAQFAEFYGLYPKKKSPGAARKAFAKAVRTEGGFERIMSGLRAQLPGMLEQLKRDPTFVKYPATWLNGECWEDEVRATPASAALPPSEYPELAS